MAGIHTSAKPRQPSLPDCARLHFPSVGSVAGPELTWSRCRPTALCLCVCRRDFKDELDVGCEFDYKAADLSFETGERKFPVSARVILPRLAMTIMDIKQMDRQDYLGTTITSIRR